MNITIAVADSYTHNVTNKEFSYKEFREYILGFKDVHINFINKDNQPFQTALEKCIKNRKVGIVGYVGGIFNGDKVKRDEKNLSYRNLIVLDIDDYSKGLSNLEQLLHNELGRYKYLAHSTINHTPDKPRIRIILFPNRNIDKKEFKTVVNNFSATLNFKIDESSTKPNQFMLVAVTPKVSNLPKDKEEYKYIPWQLENEEGELINVEEYTQDKILTENDEHLEETDIINSYKNLPSGLTVEEIIKYLDFCNPKSVDYHLFIDVGMALHHEFRGSDEGKEIWKEWAKKYKRSEDNIDKIDYKWSTFEINNTADKNVKMGTIIKKYNEFHKKADSKESTNCPELRELLNEIKTDAIQYNEETGEQKSVPLDSFKYEKRIKEIKTRLVRENIGLDRKKDPNFIALNNIYSNIREYNNLLSLDKNEDKPYTRKQFLEDVAKNINGLKTGFIELDKHVIIQPSSLAFIAGRPSHGKTTMMLNILRNMLEDEDNKDKAFLFYSYEETRSDIFIKMVLSVANDSGLDEELKKLGVEGVNLRQRALNQFKSHTQNDIPLHRILATADNKVNSWIEEGRLEILTPINSTESLKAAIIKRCMSFQREEQQAQHTEVKKEVAAVFIDYVQKLSTEEKRDNRQQEIQRICQTLLSTALDKRVATSIILGAQANREVKSLDTLTIDNMRESGDIEQDANLVLGIWDEQAGELDSLQREQQEIQKKIEEKEDYNEKLSEKLATVNKKINERNSRNSQYKPLKIKVLKNRNGAKDVTIDLYCYPNLFRINDQNNHEAVIISKHVRENENNYK